MAKNLNKISVYRIYAYSVVILIMISLPGKTSAQEYDPGAWYMYFGTNRVSDKFSIHTEAQFRFYNTFGKWNQILLRTGLNLHIDDRAMVTLGYAYIPVWDEQTGLRSVNEHRIFEQFIMRNSVGRVQFEHRYRLEQRWLENYQEASNTYENRTRYRLYLAVPFGRQSLDPKTFYYAFYNEIFIDIDSDPFNQNRFYNAIGYQISKITSVQAGYLLLSLNTGTEITHYNNIQFAVIINPDFRKQN